jgi:hypothetical protein
VSHIKAEILPHPWGYTKVQDVFDSVYYDCKVCTFSVSLLAYKLLFFIRVPFSVEDQFAYIKKCRPYSVFVEYCVFSLFFLFSFSLCIITYPKFVYKEEDYTLQSENTFNVVIYIKQDATLHSLFVWKLLCRFRVVPPPIIRSANNCIYSIWYLSDGYCYLPL